MLVLTRKHGEAIVIGEGDKEIRIVVLIGRGARMKLCVDAPREIPIRREPGKSLDNTDD